MDAISDIVSEEAMSPTIGEPRDPSATPNLTKGKKQLKHDFSFSVCGEDEVQHQGTLGGEI